jgi:hypothetical protein
MYWKTDLLAATCYTKKTSTWNILRRFGEKKQVLKAQKYTNTKHKLMR